MIPTKGMLDYAWRAGQVAAKFPINLKLAPMLPDTEKTVSILNSGRGFKLLSTEKVNFGTWSKPREVHTIAFGNPVKVLGFEMGHTLPTDPPVITIAMGLVLKWKAKDPRGTKRDFLIEKEVASWTIHELVHVGDKRAIRGTVACRDCRKLKSLLREAIANRENKKVISELMTAIGTAYYSMPEEVDAFEAQRIADAIFRLRLDIGEKKYFNSLIDHLELGYQTNRILNTAYSNVDEIWIHFPKIWKKFIRNYRNAVAKF